MQDLVSIIIPCYNAENSISRTLKSVLEQDFKNLEIIIVDDGSVDNSLEIISRFQKFDKRIKVVNQLNAGVSVARNNGLKRVKGNYIIFLDADDNYTTPYAISKMMSSLLQEKADMVVCNFTHPCFEISTKGNKVFNLNNNHDFIEFYQDFFLFGMPWNKITKRDCLTEKFVEGITFNEDELFNIDNLKNLKKVVFVDEVLHNYYCAPYNPNLPASAVNSIYSQDNFWEKKSTIWHIGMKNHGYRVKSLTKFFPSKIDELKFVRSFDFFFWDFFLMAKNNVKQDCVIHTCKTIFETELFKKTLKHKELYGLKLLEITNKNIKSFVELAYGAFLDIKSCNKKLSMVKVFAILFAYCFYELTENINKVDLLAKSAKEFFELSSAESCYVKSLIDMFNMEENKNIGF